MAPDIPGKLEHGRKAPLGEVPIPLGPKRCLLVREVEGVDHTPALPAVVVGGKRPQTRIGSMRNVAQPRSGDIDWIDVQRQ
ncbi:MAG: hypothetical protein ACRDLU_03445 [Gaiellaceae bacterium]|jgi:hypothetical protein